MITFEVKDMTCGHCVSTITRALKEVDRDARVQIDRATHRVQIESTEADAEELGDAIKEAGYTPVAFTLPSSIGESSGATAKKGCCCG